MFNLLVDVLLASGGLVPGQFCEKECHSADIGKSSECESGPDESGESEPAGVDQESEGDADEYHESGTESDLAIE